MRTRSSVSSIVRGKYGSRRRCVMERRTLAPQRVLAGPRRATLGCAAARNSRNVPKFPGSLERPGERFVFRLQEADVAENAAPAPCNWRLPAEATGRASASGFVARKDAAEERSAFVLPARSSLPHRSRRGSADRPRVPAPAPASRSENALTASLVRCFRRRCPRAPAARSLPGGRSGDRAPLDCIRRGVHSDQRRLRWMGTQDGDGSWRSA